GSRGPEPAQVRRAGAGEAVVGEDGPRAHHHAVLDGDGRADVDEGVDLDAMANADVVGDVGLLADDAVLPDPRRVPDVHAVPDGGAVSDLHARLDDRSRMDAGAHARRAAPRAGSPFSDPLTRRQWFSRSDAYAVSMTSTDASASS